MPIAGVIILTEPTQADQILSDLQEVSGLTTYGIHDENNIVAVLETETASELREISTAIKEDIPGILGVYPAYVNYEDLAS